MFNCDNLKPVRGHISYFYDSFKVQCTFTHLELFTSSAIVLCIQLQSHNPLHIFMVYIFTMVLGVNANEHKLQIEERNVIQG